jgi:hypothetical protein
MSWLFSRVLVEEYSEANSSDGELSALSSLTHTPRAYCSQDKMMDFSRLSRFGMTFGPLMDDIGAGLLMWYLEGFPARTYPQLERAQASLENEAGCGWKWRESSVKYDPDSRSWRTRQCSLFEDSEWFSETWPRWGMMRDGECWELPMSARPILERGSGLWHTPRVQACRPCKPRTQQYCRNGENGNLEEQIAVQMGVTSGYLNPFWLEWLMGWPHGWSELRPLEMDRSHNAPLKRGAS